MRGDDLRHGDDLTASVQFARDHITDFITEVDKASGSRDLVERMQGRYPGRGNPSAVILSAVIALERRRS
jgi:hypothetical protein